MFPVLAQCSISLTKLERCNEMMNDELVVARSEILVVKLFNMNGS